jgi:shikimate kinase
MGAGKSTVAGELKDKLEMDRVEMDQMIVENRGMSISEIFDEFGEAYFRNLESNTLIELHDIFENIKYLFLKFIVAKLCRKCICLLFLLLRL